MSQHAKLLTEILRLLDAGDLQPRSAAGRRIAFTIRQLQIDTRIRCRFCRATITSDGRSWRDRTDGDCCSGNPETLENENGVHQPWTDPAKLQPTGDHARDTLISERLGLRSEQS